MGHCLVPDPGVPPERIVKLFQEAKEHIRGERGLTEALNLPQMLVFRPHLRDTGTANLPLKRPLLWNFRNLPFMRSQIVYAVQQVYFVTFLFLAPHILY